MAAEVAALGPVPSVACRLPRVGACAFTLRLITLDELQAIVFSRGSSTSSASDGISMNIVRLIFESQGLALLHLINSSILTCEIPNSWKHALVHPIFKSGDSSDPTSFRPISIIPSISKILERAVHQQLYAYLSDNHLLASSQHGFRPRHSCESALVSITDHILSANDRGEVSLLCLLDLSKCFDVIDHSRLLEKLQAHSIDTSWFSAYFRHHTQSVSLPADSLGVSKVSSSLPNNMGVFQGSCLGPLLYCIFANDLSMYAEDAVVVQYADDTQVLVSGKKSHFRTLIQRMENVLASLDVWFRGNGLKVNANKTQLILLGSAPNIRQIDDFTVKFRGHDLVPTMNVKNLGLTFDRVLSWDSHISLLTRQCFGILSGLSHLRHCLPPRVISPIVSSLVISRVRYCITVFGNGTQTNNTRLQKIINYAAKVIFGRKKFDHVSDLLEDLGWLSAGELARYHTLVLVHKLVRFGEPEELARGFEEVRFMRERSTRRDRDLWIPRSRSNMGQRRFLARGPLMYNDLPADIKELPVPAFCRALKGHIISERN